jgi:hypothetical protein
MIRVKVGGRLDKFLGQIVVRWSADKCVMNLMKKSIVRRPLPAFWKSCVSDVGLME